MTVIDVNSGKFKGNAKKGKEDAIFAINMEAAGEVMRQLRLRNIGGIIVCDFIDMQKDENGELLLEYMRNLAKNDFEQPSVIDITKLGLVEITRKRS
jgi:ribonuclease G